MNTADEYRFVTGGLPDTQIRRTRARVWTATAKNPRAVAALLNGLVHHSQDRAARTITPKYSHWQRKNGSNRLRKNSRSVVPTSASLSWATYVSRYSRTAALKSAALSAL